MTIKQFHERLETCRDYSAARQYAFIIDRKQAWWKVEDGIEEQRYLFFAEYPFSHSKEQIHTDAERDWKWWKREKNSKRSR